MNKNKAQIIILLLFLLPNIAWPEKVLSGSKSLPKEFNLLLESLHLYSPEAIEKIRPQIFSIDYHARYFANEDLLFLIKVEIYKTFLKSYDVPSKIPVDGKSIEVIKLAISKSQDNFMTWFLNALLKDTQDLINNPFYKEFLLQKDVNVKIQKVDYRKAQKKAELLQSWISKIYPSTDDFPDNFKTRLAPKLLESIANIDKSLSFIVRESYSGIKITEPKLDSDLKFISFKDFVVPEKKPNGLTGESKSVEDILAPVIGSPLENLPAPVPDSWIEEPEANPILPKPANDAEWLEDF
ncbi:MAG: hypothetical protein HOP07_00375 [Bacteriovoracaceae bacterium]|nr:hypothetical protein [Bacteriovoracaceae bacterium]